MYKQEYNSSIDMNEAIVAFVSAFRQPGAIRKNFSYGDFLSDRMLLIQAIRAGLPYNIFSLISRNSPFSDEEWAGFLGISMKSLQRYKNAVNFRFRPIHSEKILEIAEVIEKGRSVFDDEARFLMWLRSPVFALGNLSPLDLISDSYGKELVMGELHRIDYGIFA